MKNHLLCLMFLLSCSVTAWAQQRVSGTVTGSDGIALIGVNVIEKGTANGTITDIDGKYSVEVSDNATLVYSLVGFETKEVPVTSGEINLVLSEGVALDEVVVTALGIEKEKKALAYSVTEIGAERLAQARETNVVNSLAGRVAGVNVASSATGAAGSTRVVIRGNSSISGNNQPLYVVDGIPIDNTSLGSAGMWGGSDGGDGISSLNPDDIESISVLKGNSAAALYGYRASNGVILIKTKSGAKRQGIGVEFNTQFRSDNIIDNYDFQNQYGHGRDGVKPSDAEQALAQTLYAWGAKLDGSNVVQFDGVSRPYSSAGDNLGRFYETGSTWTNTLALSGGNDKSNFRFSASNLDNEDVVPNSGLTRRTFTLKANNRFGEKLTSTITASYISEQADNRPRLSDSPGNANYTVWSLAPSINVNDLKGPTDKLGAGEDGTEFLFNDNGFATNPWWAAYQFENNSNKNRLLGNFRMRYDIVEGLFIQGRIGLDRYVNRTRSLTPYGTAYSRNGGLTEANRTVQELNTELLLGYDKRLTEDIGLTLYVGGNQQRNQDETVGISGGNFSVPFLHSVVNLGNVSSSFGFSESQVNSIYGSAELALFNSLYLSGTVRNDWFSTLTQPIGSPLESDNSKLYSSAGLSWVFSDMADLPEFVTYGKLRASWAEVGGATSPYRLSQTYTIVGQGHQGNPLGAISGGSIPNANLIPLTSREIEVGTDLRFINNRVGLDLAWYKRETTDDILTAAVSPTSGYSSKVVNVGKIENKGIEMLLTLRPVQTNDFSWDLYFNYSKNTNKVVSLLTEEDDGEDLRVGESRTRNAYIHHVEGLPYSQIMGFAYERDASGNITLDDDGLPVQGEFMAFGTGVHPNQFGLGNTFNYKNLSLSFLIDVKTGGKIYAATNAYGYFRGLHKATLEGRESGIGQVPAENVEDYYQRIAFNISEQFIEDADFAKLREIVVSYTIPKSALGNLPFSGISFGLAGRNLGLLWSKVDNIDPESTYTSGNDQGLEMFGVPQSRSIMFNLGVKF